MQLKIKRSEEELSEYIDAKHALTEATNRLKLAEQRLIEKMTREERKSYSAKLGGKTYRATFVQNMRTVIDEPGLKKAMGAVAFRKVTKQVIDRKKLEAAMESGTADPLIVGQYVKEEPSSPFVRFTEGAATDEHDSSSAEQV